MGFLLCYAALGLEIALATYLTTKTTKNFFKNKKDMNFYQNVYEVLQASEDIYNEFNIPKQDALGFLNHDYTEILNFRKIAHKHPKKYYVSSDKEYINSLKFSTYFNLQTYSDDKKIEKALANHPVFKDWWNSQTFNKIQQPEK